MYPQHQTQRQRQDLTVCVPAIQAAQRRNQAYLAVFVLCCSGRRWGRWCMRPSIQPEWPPGRAAGVA